MTADADPISMLRARLAEARTALLEAVTGLTERDFAAALEGASSETVVGLLAAIVESEYDAVRRVRAAIPALETRPSQPGVGERPARVLPPQVVHGLAGARRETTLLLETLEAIGNSSRALDSPLKPADDQPVTTVRSLLEAIARREQEAAMRIRNRPAG